MANPAPTINQINAFNATQGTVIDFNIIGGTELVRSNKIYIYDLSDNSLICTHLYSSTESIHELPPNNDADIVYADGKSSADFVNNKQYYAQIQTFTNVAGTQGGSGLSVAKLFWCLPTPSLEFDTIPASISITSYNATATYDSNITSQSVTVPNIVQQYQFDLYTATGTLVQSSGVIVGNGEQEGATTVWDLSYNFSGMTPNTSYYFTLSVTTTEGMTLTTQSSTFMVSIDTPTLGKATVVNDACNGYISVTSNLSSEYGRSASGSIASFTVDSINHISKCEVTLEPIQDLNGYDAPWVGGGGKNKLDFSLASLSSATLSGTAENFTITDTGSSYNYAAFSVLSLAGKGTFYFSGSAERSATTSNVGCFQLFYNDGSNHYQSLGTYGNDNKCTATDVSFSIPSGATTARIICYSNNYGSGGEGVTATFKNVRVCAEQNTTWTPYSNICPISGRSSVGVTNGGVNLFNGEYDVLYKLPEPIPRQTWVTASAKTSGNTQIYYYDINGDYIDYYTLNLTDPNDSSRKYRTFQMSLYDSMPDVYYVKFTNASATEMQLELSSSGATPSAYHAPTTHTIPLGQTVYGGKVDVVSGDGSDEYSYKVFDGSNDEGWTVANASGHYRAYCSISDIKSFSGAYTEVSDYYICDSYKNGAWSDVYGGKSVCGMTGTYIGVGIDDLGITDVAGWLAYLSTHNIAIAYKKATADSISVTPTQISCLLGQNNIFSDSGDITIDYNILITNLLVKRKDLSDVSGTWLTLYEKPILQASDMDFTYIDFLNQYGKTYQYALVPLLIQSQSGVVVEVEGGYTVSDNVLSQFDYVFITDVTGSEKLKANVGYGNVNMSQNVGSILPIGAKYPVVVTNSHNAYHSGSISGYIVPDDFYTNGNLSRVAMVAKRDEVEQFLVNKKPKIIKDWNGKIWLVMITGDVDCSFDSNYGMGMVTFTASWVEVGDATSQEDLQNTGLINVGGV